MVESRKVRLPVSSSRRSAIRFIKLLERVDQKPMNGFQFGGRFLRPGALISEADLPQRAVLLEGAGSEGSGRRDSKYLYILWQFDWGRREWVELARVWAECWEWAMELGPIAQRALEPVQPVPDVRRAAERLSAVIQREMAAFEEAQRAQLAAVLHDRFATHIAAAAA